MTHNYISRLDSIRGTFHIYHSNTIIFDNRQLSELIIPGLLHELKVKSKYPEMFENVITAPSLYQLPSYIIADKLTDELRSTLARTLLFVHTWTFENSNLHNNTLIASPYDTYEDFFNETLKFIINNEHNSRIRNIAIDLKQSIRQISPYLGVYHGNLEHIIHDTNDIIPVLSIMCLYFISKNT